MVNGLFLRLTKQVWLSVCPQSQIGCSKVTLSTAEAWQGRPRAEEDLLHCLCTQNRRRKLNAISELSGHGALHMEPEESAAIPSYNDMVDVPPLTWEMQARAICLLSRGERLLQIGGDH